MAYKLRLFFFFVLYLLKSVNLLHTLTQDNYLLLVISLDGFRYDYIDRYSLPNGFLRTLSEDGVRGKSESIFPTNTYPNHWSIVTGVHPETHGILNNDVYDTNIGRKFRMDVDDEETPSGWFQSTQPIWITNEIVNGPKLNKHSVVFDWPGAPAPFNNKQPKVYRQTKSENWVLSEFNKTVDLFVKNIQKNLTNLAFLYIGEPDVTGHLYGPNSVEIEHVVKELDYVLDNLLRKLETEKFYDIKNEIDILIVTDHGMETIRLPNEESERRHIYLTDYLDVDKYLLLNKCSYGSLSELWLKSDEDFDFVYNSLSRIKSIEPDKFKAVYTREDIPERFGFKYAKHRLATFLLLAKSGYQIILERNKSQKYSVTKYLGNHGFDAEEESMRGIFIANGRSFRKNYLTKRPVKVIDIYSLMCHLIDIEPNPNNGSLTRLEHILFGNNQNHMDL